MFRKAIGSAFVVGTLSVSVLAVTPCGSALAQVPPPTCAQQMQACKDQVMNTRNSCLPSCASNSDPNTCRQSLQDQFVELIQFCNDRMATCIAEQVPTGSYSRSCTDISVSAEGTLTAQCLDVHGIDQSAELANAYACDSDIINVNGVLVCGVNGCAL